jgi:hypothetical protein
MFLKLISCLILSLFLATPVLAGDYGLSETAGAAGLTSFGTNLPGLVGNIIGTGLSLVGVLFFALMLYGGIMWMTARGNAEQEKKSLETITAAIIGILIVLGSYALTSFVFNNLMGGGGVNPPAPPPQKQCTAIGTDNVAALCATGKQDQGTCELYPEFCNYDELTKNCLPITDDAKYCSSLGDKCTTGNNATVCKSG